MIWPNTSTSWGVIQKKAPEVKKVKVTPSTFRNPENYSHGGHFQRRFLRRTCLDCDSVTSSLIIMSLRSMVIMFRNPLVFQHLVRKALVSILPHQRIKMEV